MCNNDGGVGLYWFSTVALNFHEISGLNNTHLLSHHFSGTGFWDGSAQHLTRIQSRCKWGLQSYLRLPQRIQILIVVRLKTSISC